MVCGRAEGVSPEGLGLLGKVADEVHWGYAGSAY